MQKGALLLTCLLMAQAAARAHAAPPTITCPGPQFTLENGGVNVTITASDPDGDPVILSIVQPPPRAEFDPPSGIFNWVPSYTQAGNYSIRFRAVAAGETTSCVMPVTVENFNRVPRITCPTGRSAVVGDTLKVTLTATDPDLDPLTFSSAALPAGATLSPQGLFVWRTSGVAPGNYVIPVSVSDGSISSSCNLAVAIYGLSPSPRIFCPGSVAVTELQTLDFDIVREDPNGLPVTVTVSGLPPGATFNTTTLHFKWTPSLSQSGSYPIVFSATNNQSPPATCTVLVTVVDRAVQSPFFTLCPGAVTATELQTVQFQATAVDPQGFPVTYSATGVPAGAVFSTSNGLFTWTPTAVQAGTYSLVITASNGAASTACTVPMTINNRVFQPPTVTCPPAQQVLERRELAFTVSASDPQGLPVTITLTNPPAGATTFANGIFRWTPGPAQSGVYLLHFVASNGDASASCDVNVTVIDRPLAPPRLACVPGIASLETRPIDIVIQATDPDNDPLVFSGRNLPGGSSVDPVGRFRWTPTSGQAGIYLPEFVVTDGESRDSCKVRIEVLDHDAPVTPLETRIVRVSDIRPDQGGWVRVLLVTASSDVFGASPAVTGYDLWRRIDGPRRAAASMPDEGAPTLDAVRPGTVLAEGAALALGFPDGAWEAVAHAPALQVLNLTLAAPTRDDSTSAGRPWEVFVVTTHTTVPSTWAVSVADSGYSVDDLPPAAPAVFEARQQGTSVALAWHGVPDLDLARFVVHRGSGEGFVAAEGNRLGQTSDSSFIDAAPSAGSWYRVVALDTHGNQSASQAVAGPGAAAGLPALLALSAPRPNPARGEVAFEVALPVAGPVALSIIDPRGRVLRVLESAPLAAGRHPYAWDGKDRLGRRAAAGVYVIRLETAGGVRARKLVFTR